MTVMSWTPLQEVCVAAAIVKVERRFSLGHQGVLVFGETTATAARTGRGYIPTFLGPRDLAFASNLDQTVNILTPRHPPSS